MMDKEIVIEYDDETKMINFYFFYEIIFMNNIEQLKKYCHGMSVSPPTLTQLLSTTLYIYIVQN